MGKYAAFFNVKKCLRLCKICFIFFYFNARGCYAWVNTTLKTLEGSSTLVEWTFDRKHI